MKKLFIICMTALCIMTISGCREDYSDQMRLAEDYLNSGLSIDCTVVDCYFQQHDRGINGGLFMYDFVCRGSDGEEFTAGYRGYADLSAETITRLTVDKGD